ncbi:MAG: preprotein translocase subunit SecE [Candidatus Hydrogenedentes bacterium]|nr:preprotein translocase subunit SecE [Candidatus Hydrogenedentota bacterium]
MATATEQKLGPIARLQVFYDEVMAEMSKVTWPTLDDLKVSTKVTMFLLLAMAAIVFLFDKIFEQFVLMLLNLTG